MKPLLLIAAVETSSNVCALVGWCFFMVIAMATYIIDPAYIDSPEMLRALQILIGLSVIGVVSRMIKERLTPAPKGGEW